MKQSTGSRITFLGICIFVVLYFVSACFYPGGSQADKAVKGFSWLNNFWCDLLNEQAKNGQYNAARPIAISSWLVLCFSIMIFWYFLPSLLQVNDVVKKTIRFCGVAAMLVSTLLFTQLHDMVIHTASLLGLIAICGTFAGFYKSGYRRFLYTGLFCLALMCLNYFIMVSNTFATYLPVIQKITFVAVLVSVSFVNRELYRLAQQQAN